MQCWAGRTMQCSVKAPVAIEFCVKVLHVPSRMCSGDGNCVTDPDSTDIDSDEEEGRVSSVSSESEVASTVGRSCSDVSVFEEAIKSAVNGASRKGFTLKKSRHANPNKKTDNKILQKEAQRRYDQQKRIAILARGCGN